MAQGVKEWGQSKVMLLGEGRAGKTGLARAMMGKEFIETDSTIGIDQISMNVEYAGIANENSSDWNVLDKKPEKSFEAGVAKMIVDKQQNRPYRGVKFEFTINEGGGCMDESQLDKQDYELTGNDVNDKNSSKDSSNNQKMSARQATQASNSSNYKRLGVAVVVVIVIVVVIAFLKVDPSIRHLTITLALLCWTWPMLKIGVKKSQSDPISVIEPKLKHDGTRMLMDSDLEQDVVMKCFNDPIQANSKFLISLYDFGGQSVFNVVHPFFLTRYGVYLVVFNMEWLAKGSQHFDECLSFLLFWMK